MREIAIESSQHSAGIKLWVVLSVSTTITTTTIAASWWRSFSAEVQQQPEPTFRYT